MKILQKDLSILLLDCIDEINLSRSNKNTLAHGFVRKKSIITTAKMHRNKKNILNIDLENFFGQFNFGRVRGFFLKNRNFLLQEKIATIIAKIACYNNELPQGSPCSPVITNLITHSLDIQLASLAKKYSCTYSRYADDITFSTRKNKFPKQIMIQDGTNFTPSSRLSKEINRAGFKLNNNKTRIQYKNSRQDVTGLVINKKIGVKKEYRQITKSMCNKLFYKGEFSILVDGEYKLGTMNELEGRLNFIDSIDHYNRKNYKSKSNNQNKNALNGREKTLSKFLFYKNFHHNDKPVILCEGKTDITYLKVALKNIKYEYPKLVKKTSNNNELLVNFFNNSKRTKFFLGLDGGTSYLAKFISGYEKYYKNYSGLVKHPVIIILAYRPNNCV